MKNDELSLLISIWMYYNEKLREINNELYCRTELYEGKYEYEFAENLHNFFAKKITRFNKDLNTLYKVIEQEEIITKNYNNDLTKLVRENYVKIMKFDKKIK